MQTLLLGGTRNLTKDQSRIVCALAVFTICVVGLIHNWWSEGFIRVDLNAVSRPAFNTPPKTESEIEIESAYERGLAVAKRSSLGAMGNSYAKSSSNNSILEKEISNDEVLATMMANGKTKLNRIENDVKTQIEKIKTENMRKRQLESITCDPSDITRISNMTEEQIGEMVEGTWLEGKEDILYQVEQEEGINVFFIYAASTLESDHGNSYRATTRHNYYGLETKKDYGSYENNTKYFGDMMNRIYISKGNISVDDIGPIYCPPNRDWENKISKIMLDQYEKITTPTVA